MHAASRTRNIAVAALMAAGIAACAVTRQEPVPVRSVAAGATPKFAVDPYWPRALPENWIVGQVSGIAVDRHDHICIVHRPGTLLDDEKGAQQNQIGRAHV